METLPEYTVAAVVACISRDFQLRDVSLDMFLYLLRTKQQTGREDQRRIETSASLLLKVCLDDESMPV